MATTTVRRFLGEKLELEERDGKSPKIRGHAAVFYDGTERTEFTIPGWFRERIMPGAFDRAIADRDDARALFNHDPNQLLGRVSSGTLALSKDSVGLRYEIDPGDTTVARDVLEHLKRGDLTGSSFAFRIAKQVWQEIEGEDPIREIHDVELFDVGPVTYPAYEATDAAVRAASSEDVPKRGFVAAVHASARARVQELLLTL